MSTSGPREHDEPAIGDGDDTVGAGAPIAAPGAAEREQHILAATAAHVRVALAQESTGHDWWHIARVWRMARQLAREEGADSFVCELAALLHDLADDKVAGDEERGRRDVGAWLEAQCVPEAAAAHVLHIIATMSFGGGNRPPMATLEGRVVQDADRLDALGALGIARAFAFGGSRGRVLYDPDQPPRCYADKAAYRASNSSTINHFHEKLLLLTDHMNTATARRIAAARHAYMEAFLLEFNAEWAGER